MGLTAFPNGVSSFGMPLIGSGPILTTGRTKFIHYSTGVDAPGRGDDPSVPIKTLAYAIDTFGRSGYHDIYLLMPGHTETISVASGINLDVSDCRIIGLGTGSNRPTITLSGVTGVSIAVAAANITFENVIISMTGVDAIVAGIIVTAADFQMRNCLVNVGDATNQAVLGVSLGAGSDRPVFENCEFISRSAGATAFIQGVVAIDGLKVIGCFFDGDTTACVRNTTIAWTNAWILRNVFYNRGSGKSVIVDGSTTGVVAENYSLVTANIAAGGSMTAAAMFKAQNYAQEVAGVASSAVLDPTSAAIS